jgi:4-methylaminobutanoate oxidase (formaldehyde-forming)
VSPDESPAEAGLGFSVAWNKPGGFIGRDAALAIKEAGLRQRLVQFALHDDGKLLYHNEPIWRDGVLVGRITSGMYGHFLGRSIGMGYVHNADGIADNDWINAGTYELEVAGMRVGADAQLAPWYDPKSLRVKA